jgi:succinate-semialdehyde dehydrogenase/glutarate-semialdehyde dehydrogenase
MVGINCGVVSESPFPFGGVKESGFGREGGSGGIDEYTVVKSWSLGGMGGELQG